LPRVFVKTVFEAARFKCQRCGSCCHHRRPQKYEDLIPLRQLEEFWEKSNLIYLTEEDIERISRKTGLVAKDFVDTLYEYDGKFVRAEDEGRKVILDLPVMKSKEDSTCVFYNDGCTIYSVRPMACRLFPFRVEERSTSEGDLHLLIGYNAGCPGIGKGNHVEKKDLEKLVVEQFGKRSASISSEVLRLATEGKIRRDAEIYRTFPGRRSQVRKHDGRK
jgi:Fe-S-cluster containining protein